MQKVFPVLCDAVIKENSLYFFDNRIKTVCKADLTDMKLDVFAKCEIGRDLYVKKIFVTEKSLIMQNNLTADIIIFDRNGNNYKFYESGLTDDFYNVVIIGSIVYIIPLKWNGKVFSFDIDSKKYDDFGYNSEFNLIPKDSIVFRPYVVGKCIYFPSQYENSLYVIDTENHIIDKCCASDDRIKTYLAVGDGSDVWAVENNADKLYRFGKQNSIIDIPKNEYSSIRLLSDQICLMSKGKSSIVIVAKGNNEGTVMQTGGMYDEFDEVMTGATGYTNCVENDRFIFFIPNGVGKIIRFDKDSKEHEICSFTSESYWKYWSNEVFKENYLVKESGSVGLEQFVEML